MNLKSIMSTAILASILFTSCKKELEPQADSETAPVTAAPAPENPAAIEKQFEVQNQNMPATPAPQAQPTTTTAPGMNPPHGQPGHRCDIAVGAPLNSPKATPPAPTVQPTPQTVQQPTPQGQGTITPVDMSSGTVATPPGMNPPHGQPGHRCEIAVGAPLPK